jgi:hypothetical protein
MSQPSSPIDQKRLEALLDSASKYARETNQRAAQVSIDIAQEKTQYFEKLALASGGTIALVVSFVGSHAGKLQPPWLLRSSLVVLVLAMIAAMYRNWKYPFYLLAVHAKLDFDAKLDKERCRRDCIVAIPALSLQDGKPINVQEFVKGFSATETVLTEKIKEFQKTERSAFTIVKYVEQITLLLMVIAMAMLVALAWKNF